MGGKLLSSPITVETTVRTLLNGRGETVSVITMVTLGGDDADDMGADDDEPTVSVEADVEDAKEVDGAGSGAVVLIMEDGIADVIVAEAMAAVDIVETSEAADMDAGDNDGAAEDVVLAAAMPEVFCCAPISDEDAPTTDDEAFSPVEREVATVDEEGYSAEYRSEDEVFPREESL